MVEVFADLNCPFCFSLHERLLALGLIDRVQWKTIEHAPGVDARSNAPRQINQLNSEFKLVVQRAPDVVTHNPGFVPSTALANRFLLQVSEQQPGKMVAFRTALYRALWQKQQDISDPEVLAALLRQCGIEPFSSAKSHSEQLESWQAQWQTGDFDHRIPAMRSESNEVLLGLQSAATVCRFVEQGSAPSEDDAVACHYVHKDNIAVFCAPDQQAVLTELLAPEKTLQLHFYSDPQRLFDSLETDAVDLVLVQHSAQAGMALCRDIMEDSSYLDYLPIVMFSDSEDVALEHQAFYHGVTDFVCLPRQRLTLIDRLKAHIRNKQKLEILSNFASHDSLTGLNNRREFDHQFERKWRHCCRKQQTLALVLVDIDHFKDFNDHYGHPAGDDALIKVATAIKQSLFRAKDFAARIGGEEFGILVEELGEEGVSTITERIHQAIGALNIEHGPSATAPQLTVSIGVAWTQVHADNSLDLLYKLADECLYQAKQFGRNHTSSTILASPVYE